MGWPTETEIGIMARLTLTEAPTGTFKTSYGYNVTALLAQVVNDIATFCGRPLGFDQQTVTEIFDGGNRILRVTCPPIISVTSVTDNSDDSVLDVDEDEYYVYEKQIRLPRPTPTERIPQRDTTPKRWTVVYVGGYDDDGTPLPAQVVEVCAEIATRTLLRVDQQYRVYQNVEKFQDGQITSVFPDKEKEFADQWRKLEQSGMVLSVVR